MEMTLQDRLDSPGGSPVSDPDQVQSTLETAAGMPLSALGKALDSREMRRLTLRCGWPGKQGHKIAQRLTFGEFFSLAWLAGGSEAEFLINMAQLILQADW